MSSTQSPNHHHHTIPTIQIPSLVIHLLDGLTSFSLFHYVYECICELAGLKFLNYYGNIFLITHYYTIIS